MRSPRLRAGAAAAVLASFLAAGCSNLPSANPMDWFGSKPTGPKPAELPALTSPAATRVIWNASIGASEGFVFTPALVEGTVYAASRAGTVVALDAATGQARWRVAAGTRLSGASAATGRWWSWPATRAR